MQRESVLALLGAMLVLSGCAVGPEYVRPQVKINEGWSTAANAQVTTQSATDSAWWKTFNDPVLDRLIDLACSQNLSLRAAGVRIMEARAALGIAVGQQYPQLQAAMASATRISLSENLANSINFDRDFWDYQVGFDATWEADFWRRFGRGVKSQEAAYLGSVADYQDALVSLSAEVARTYATIRMFEVLIAQGRNNVGVQEEGLRIAESRYRNGATSELDVSQASALLESTRASIPQLEASLAQSQNALSTLLGQPTGSVLALLQGPHEIPMPPAQVALSVPAEMLRRRPDVRGAEFSAIAQSERIGVAKADLYPRIQLFGTIGFQTTSGSTIESGNLFDSGSLFYALGPRISWTFLDYGRTKNRVRVEDARFQRLMVGYQDTVLKAAQEVEDSLVGYLKAQEVTGFQQNAANSARRSVELAFIQYREGAVDFQRVLDAQRSQLQEENNLARARSAVATNLIALYKALGGGWETRAGQPFVPENMREEMQKRTDWGDYFSQQPKLHSPVSR
ncbi:efflux transporter outer membrane subunit [Peristeroidobacter soli]|uniref:efflux transporter outer membrane subunit n=1 Tax=Peristeroidobacter soli TaxID=2497877 RepID=UPI00101D1D1C|nr:efflux transporter outer membrane subunit [Peristeroidobacter soli]